MSASGGSDFDLNYTKQAYLPVCLDGVVLGWIDPRIAPNLVSSLRKLKIDQSD
jgi:hypothetical protein